MKIYLSGYFRLSMFMLVGFLQLTPIGFNYQDVGISSICLAPRSSISEPEGPKREYIERIRANVGPLEPRRLTLQEAREKLLMEMRGLHGAYPALAQAFEELAAALRSVKNFEEIDKVSLQKIQTQAAKIKERVDTIRALPCIVGLWEPDIKDRIEGFLYDIAYEFKADKVFMSLADMLKDDFDYTVGFTEKELRDFYLAKGEVATDVLLRSGIASAIWALPDNALWKDNREVWIDITVGRSAQFVRQYGEFAPNDVIALSRYLDTVIKDGTAPWMGIRESLRRRGYSSFEHLMVVLRHSGGVNIFEAAISPFIARISQGLGKIKMAEDPYGARERFLKDLDHWANEINLRTIKENETFIQMLEAGLDFRPRDITSYVKERVESFDNTVRGKGLKFVTELTDEDVVVEHCDLNLLGLLIDNLIQNAIKYTETGGVIVRLKREVRMTRRDDKERLYGILEVEDTGIGIPKDEQADIFTSGYRASNVGNIAGRGIGLDVVMNIVHLMRGDIDVESEINKGTKFTIFLPVAQEILSDTEALVSAGPSRTLDSGI